MLQKGHINWISLAFLWQYVGLTHKGPQFPLQNVSFKKDLPLRSVERNLVNACSGNQLIISSLVTVLVFRSLEEAGLGQALPCSSLWNKEAASRWEPTVQTLTCTQLRGLLAASLLNSKGSGWYFLCLTITWDECQTVLIPYSVSKRSREVYIKRVLWINFSWHCDVYAGGLILYASWAQHGKFEWVPFSLL